MKLLAAKHLAACIALLGLPLAAASPASATLLIYNDFSSAAGLTLVGSTNNSAIPGVLELTTVTNFQAGAGFSADPVALGPGSTFSTRFQFRLSNPGGVGAAGWHHLRARARQCGARRADRRQYRLRPCPRQRRD